MSKCKKISCEKCPFLFVWDIFRVICVLVVLSYSLIVPVWLLNLDRIVWCCLACIVGIVGIFTLIQIKGGKNE